MFSFESKVAIVTGSTKGIGAAIAEMFAQNGASVTVVSRNMAECKAKAEQLQEKCGVECYAHSCDVKDQGSVDGLVSDVVARFGRIDILVNNAGVSVTKPSVELTAEEWARVMDTNLNGVFFMNQRVGRQMIGQQHGCIVNIASMLGLVGTQSVLPYVTSKGGVVQMTRGLALEWARYNIRVNAVAPGYVLTDINREKLSEEKMHSKIVSKTPLHRLGNAEEIASTVLYLASDEASYVTGAIYSVDGGWTAQ